MKTSILLRVSAVFSASVLFLVSCSQDGSSIKDAIALQFDAYPESRVQDIYKSFCQDNLGPGHLIPDTSYAGAYLREELATYREDVAKGLYSVPAERFFPVGDDGNYVRVDLSVVLDSLMSEQALLEAFSESANSGKVVSEEQWKEKWSEVEKVLRKDFRSIPHMEEDLASIDSLVSEGNLILHHSPKFDEAYHPHYRIIGTDIFRRDIQPLLKDAR